MNSIPKHSKLQLEYEQVNANFRFLADIRFKLLALIPALGGAAIFILSKLGLKVADPQLYSPEVLLLVALASIIGFLVTLGLTIYDQRNSQLYNALIHRAKYLEILFEASRSKGALRETETGGQFNERPSDRRKILGIKAGHDLGLALIYGPVLGAWVFPISLAVFSFFSWVRIAGLVSAGVAVALTTILTFHLIHQDREEIEKYKEAWVRDEDAEKAGPITT